MTWDIAPAADIVTQDFGCVNEPMEWPCPGCGSGRFHAGVDLGSSAGGQSIFRSPVVATRSGVVSAIGIPYLGEQAVAVKTDEGVTIEHGHLDEAHVSVGQRVNPGDVLGLLGTKGASTAPHIHVEVRVDGPFQGVGGCPQNDPTRDPMAYLNKAQNMIAGLDSSFFRPSAATALAAKAAGVRLWSGYLSTRPNVGLASPWDQASFENARLCGLTPIAYCSGNDDPVACKQLAAQWNVRLCLDVENGIRGDGGWVQGWLDAAAPCGLYGNAPVFNGRSAAFYVLAGYPGSDPSATWSGARPNGPCGWQWMGSHDEFGGGVDRGWFDPWFADLPTEVPNDMTALYQGPDGRVWSPLVFARYIDEPKTLDDLKHIEGRPEIVKLSEQYTADRVIEVKGVPKNESRTPLDFWKMQADAASAVDRLTQLQAALEKLTQPAVDITALAKAIVDQIPHNADEKVIAELVVAKLGEKLKTAPPSQ